MNCGATSKVELAKLLNLSMPTVLSNVNELMEQGLVTEQGEMESTGGRKAVLIGLQKNYRYALGVDITTNHQGMVLVNLGRQRKRVYWGWGFPCRGLLTSGNGFWSDPMRCSWKTTA